MKAVGSQKRPRKKRNQNSPPIPEKAVADSAFRDIEAFYVRDEELEKLILLESGRTNLRGLETRLRTLSEKKSFRISIIQIGVGETNHLDRNVALVCRDIAGALATYGAHYQHSPHVAAMFGLAVARGYIENGRATNKALVWHSFSHVSQPDIKAFLADLTAILRSECFKAFDALRRRKAADAERSCRALVDRVLTVHGEVQVVRVDFYMGRPGAIGADGSFSRAPLSAESKTDELLRARSLLVKTMADHEAFSGCLGWLHMPGVSEFSGPVIHGIYLFKTNTIFSNTLQAKAIGARWVAQTRGVGGWHDCRFDMNVYKKLCVGQVSRDDPVAMRELYRSIHYVTHRNYWLGLHLPKNSDAFWRSEIPGTTGRKNHAIRKNCGQ